MLIELGIIAVAVVGVVVSIYALFAPLEEAIKAERGMRRAIADDYIASTASTPQSDRKPAAAPPGQAPAPAVPRDL